MKIIFLDIDGVLATAGSYEKPRYFPTSSWGEKWHRKGGFPGLDTKCVERLNQLKDTGARVVISSTWRHGLEDDFSDLIGYLHEEGLELSVIGRTPSHRNTFSAYRGHGYARGDEIKEWLDSHPEVTRFVVIDDDAHDMEAVKDNFVWVEDGWSYPEYDGPGHARWVPGQGLLQEHVDKARELLEGE